MELIKTIYECNSLSQDYPFYQQALKEIEQDGIASQVYFLLKQQGRLEQMPPFFQSFLKQNYEKGLFQNLFIKNQTNEIIQGFDGHGIDVIPLKGVYFAEKYFGNIGARATSDIDLLIRYQDLKKAIDIVKSLGFVVEEEQIPGHFHCSFSKELPHSTMPLVVELHWSLVKESTSRFDIQDFWNHAKPVGHSVHLKELSPNDTFYMICLHGWRHNLDSMKYFIDMIQVINQNSMELDYEKLLGLAKKHQTHKRMIRTLSILYQQFPHLEAIKPFPYKKNFPLWKYRNTQDFKKYLDFIDYQFLSYDNVKHSIIELLQWILPSTYEASSHLNESHSGPRMYISLYKKRITSMIKLILSH